MCQISKSIFVLWSFPLMALLLGAKNMCSKVRGTPNSQGCGTGRLKINNRVPLYIDQLLWHSRISQLAKSVLSQDF
jgi:hypothetical protein